MSKKTRSNTIGPRLAALMDLRPTITLTGAQAIIGPVAEDTFRIVQALHGLEDDKAIKAVRSGEMTPQQAVSSMELPDDLTGKVAELVERYGTELVRRAVAG